MSIAEKLQTIAENEQKVYHAGELSLAPLLSDTVTNYRLPNGFTHLKGDVFGATWYLNYVTIPSSVVDLANGVFRNAYNLLKVTFEGGEITRFGSNMFQGSSKLKTIIFGCNLKNADIASGTFTNCTALETVTFTQETLNKNVYIHNTSKLKKSCAYEIMRKLANHTGTDEELTYTFKLHATVWANVEDTTAEDYEAPPSGTTWQDFVTNYRGYNI